MWIKYVDLHHAWDACSTWRIMEIYLLNFVDVLYTDLFRRETRGWFFQQIQQVIQPHGRWISIQTPDNLPFRDLKEAVVTDEWTNYLGLLTWIQTPN